MALKSPFPGMDPWLEQHWGDVHHRLITYACDALQERLPYDLRARMQERVFVESDVEPDRIIYPDVHVVERGRAAAVSADQMDDADVAVEDPLVLHMPRERVTQGYIEVIDFGTGNRVITVIEVLSISTKFPGEGQKLYLQKQRELKKGGVSSVEIDLLRAGKRILMARPSMLPRSYRTAYQVCVRRSWKDTELEIYRAPLRERLPRIRVPLRETDKDVPLDLQALVERCYQNGRYDDLDYSRELMPPLKDDDAAWASELMKSRSSTP